jgi:hypothetical protein
LGKNQEEIEGIANDNANANIDKWKLNDFLKSWPLWVSIILQSMYQREILVNVTNKVLYTILKVGTREKRNWSTIVLIQIGVEVTWWKWYQEKVIEGLVNKTKKANIFYIGPIFINLYKWFPIDQPL